MGKTYAKALYLCQCLKSLGTELILENIKKSFCFLLLLNIDMVQVVEMFDALAPIRTGP